MNDDQRKPKVKKDDEEPVDIHRTLGLRSIEKIIPAKLVIFNLTMKEVELLWINQQGNIGMKSKIKSLKSHTLNCYVSEVIIVHCDGKVMQIIRKPDSRSTQPQQFYIPESEGTHHLICYD